MRCDDATRRERYRGGAAVSALLVTGCLALAACQDDSPRDDDAEVADATGGEETASSSADDESTGEPAAGEQSVPLDAVPLPLDATCFELDEEPIEVSSSPEGHLWLRLDEQTWRVVDPFGNDEIQLLPPGVTALQARGHDRALVIDDGALQYVQGQWPQPLAWPETRAEPVALCGDPSRDGNGFVVAEGLLHRDAGQWWEWTDPAGQSWSDVVWMARSAGTCLGADGGLWLATGNGEVWRITGAQASRQESFDGAHEAALVDDGAVAVLLDDELLVGDLDETTRYRFESGAASALSSGGEALWVIAGGALYRLHDGEFSAAVHEGEPIEADAVRADGSGGVWTLTTERACHLRPGPMVRVEGVYNLQRLADETVEIAVELSVGTSLEAVTLDGTALEMEPGGLSRFIAAPQTIDLGWHTLEIEVENRDGYSQRRVSFEQRRVGDLTWVGDVEPLFMEHCSGAGCHGSEIDDTTRPDLSSWEAWTEREDSILERVIAKGDMPPSGARKDTWGPQLQLVISEWFESGAPKEDEG